MGLQKVAAGTILCQNATVLRDVFWEKVHAEQGGGRGATSVSPLSETAQPNRKEE